MKRATFGHIRPGEVVCRLLVGRIPILMTVARVDEERIYCDEDGMTWSFDRLTGAEIDDGIGWGPRYGTTGSYLVEAGGETQG